MPPRSSALREPPRFRLIGAVLALAVLANPAGAQDAPAPSTARVQPDVPARLLKSGRPEYPLLLRKTGNRGNVTVYYQVRSSGELANFTVLASDHPAFEQAVMEWLLRQKASPAMKSGVAVDAWVTQSYHFELQGAGLDPFSPPAVPAAGMREDLRYDTPPKIRYVAPLVYPRDKLAAGVDGTARLNVLLGPDGKVHVVKVLASSNEEFGYAAKASLEAWRFEPARKNGQPSWALFSYEQKFDDADREARVNDSAQHLLQLVTSGAPGIATLKDLDAPLVPRYRPTPVYPPELKDAGVGGNARIEFLVDRDGAAQLPRVLSADNPQFGWAAVTAVSRWRFDPPLRNGRAVDVQAEVPVVFTPAAQH